MYTSVKFTEVRKKVFDRKRFSSSTLQKIWREMPARQLMNLMLCDKFKLKTSSRSAWRNL